jgi:hypothetical protein
MSRLCWWLVDFVSRALHPDERDAVRGDIAESGDSAGRALLDLTGLVVRRQADPWKAWRPWVGLIGLVLPVGFLLSVSSMSLDRTFDLYLWIMRNYGTMDPATLNETGLTLRHGAILLGSGCLVICAWSWMSGFVLGALSRRAIWVNGSLFLLVPAIVEFSFPQRGHRYDVTPLLLNAALVLVPAGLGMRRSMRYPRLPIVGTIMWTAAIVAGMLVRKWPPFKLAGLWQLAGLWPVAYMIAIVFGQSKRTKERG